MLARRLTTRTNTISKGQVRAVSSRKDFAMRHLAPGIGRATDFEIVSGKGSYVHTSCGRSLLDFTCGIGVTNLGHSHPSVVKAVQEQAASAMHIQVNIAWHSKMLDLIEKLLEVSPAPELDTFFFWNSGAEAVEAAVKLARHATKRQNIIVFDGSYHGRTFGTMPLTTSKTIYSAGLKQRDLVLMKQSQLRHGNDYKEDELIDHTLEDIEVMLKTRTAPSDTAAFLIEPILGEGGYVPAPPRFMQGLKEIAKKNDILLMVDEVQSGWGRTGKFFAVEISGVTPDVIIFAKGVGSGMPLSGIISTQELMKRQPAGSMGGTYAGNVVSCAAAVATLDVIKKENILQNVIERGAQLEEGLRALSKEFPVIKDIRGTGLMIGVEFGDTAQPIAGAVTKACSDEGMLLLTCGVRDIIRFIPPLNVSKDEIETGLQIFRKALKAVIR